MGSVMLAVSARRAVKELMHDPVSKFAFSAQIEVGGTEKQADCRKAKAFTVL